MAAQWRWERHGNDRWWDGWHESDSGLWQQIYRGWSGWDRPHRYPRDTVNDANGNILRHSTLEGWEDAMQALDSITSAVAVRHNPQYDAGNVPACSTCDRIRMDIIPVVAASRAAEATQGTDEAAVAAIVHPPSRDETRDADEK